MIKAIVIMGILITGIGFPLDAFADVVSPKKQLDLGFDKTEVFCSANHFKVIKKSSGMPACVNPKIVNKLVELGWAIPVNTELLDSFIKKVESRTSVGTVTIQAVAKQTLPPKIVTSSPAVHHYHVVVNVCSNANDIRLPEVILRSDSAVSYVKLAEKIPANVCKISAGKIQAANPDTISATLVNKGGVTKKITELENKVKELSDQLSAEKSTLATRLQQSEDPAAFKPSPERMTKISELRTQLNAAKAELNKYQFALNAVPKIKSKDIEKAKTFSGVPIEEVSLKMLTATPQLSGNDYNITFEMCAGKDMIRIPKVTISSDKDDKTINLAGKIFPNTCQISSAKLKANSVDSIQLSIADTAEQSSQVINLEKKISELSASLEKQKLAFDKLTHLAPRPADIKEQQASIAENINDLRQQIIIERAKLFSILNPIYN